MLVYLIRHPQPIEAQGLCYGREDLPVERSAVAAAAAVLRGATVFSSPMSRCLGLARELADLCEPIVSDDLVELNFGAWEGMAWEAVPRDELNAWAADVWEYRPGGGESAAMAAGRWRRWSQALQHRATDAVLAVTHAGLIRVALACAGESSGPSFASFPIPFGSIHRIVLEERAAAASLRA